MKICVTTESTINLPNNLILANNISVCKINNEFCCENYSSCDKNKEKLENKLEKFFKKNLLCNDYIVHISYSSELGPLFECARNAADKINKESRGKVFVVNSFCAGAGQGLLALKAASLINEKTSLEKILSTLDVEKMNINNVFAVQGSKNSSNNGFFQKVGNLFASVFNIKKMFEVNVCGAMVKTGKSKSGKRLLIKLANYFKIKNTGSVCYITYSNNYNDAIYLSNLIKADTGICPVVLCERKEASKGKSFNTVSICYVGNGRGF